MALVLQHGRCSALMKQVIPGSLVGGSHISTRRGSRAKACNCDISAERSGLLYQLRKIKMNISYTTSKFVIAEKPMKPDWYGY